MRYVNCLEGKDIRTILENLNNKLKEAMPPKDTDSPQTQKDLTVSSMLILDSLCKDMMYLANPAGISTVTHDMYLAAHKMSIHLDKFWSEPTSGEYHNQHRANDDIEKIKRIVDKLKAKTTLDG